MLLLCPSGVLGLKDRWGDLAKECDPSLISKLKSDNIAEAKLAFMDFFNLLREPIEVYVRSMARSRGRSISLVDDVVATTMMRVWMNRAKIPEKFVFYTMRIARNSFFNEIRRRGALLDSEMDDSNLRTTYMAGVIDTHRDGFQTILDILPDHLHQLARLRMVEEINDELELAKRLGVGRNETRLLNQDFIMRLAPPDLFELGMDILQLSEEYSMPLWYSHLEGLTGPQIATLMGIKHDEVKTLMPKAELQLSLRQKNPDEVDQATQLEAIWRRWVIDYHVYLPPDAREAVRLVDIEGMGTTEAAIYLRLSVPTFAGRLQKGREILRSNYGPEPARIDPSRERENLSREELIALIDRLPEEVRPLLLAVDVEGLTYEQAGERFGFNRDQVKHRLERSRRLLTAERLRTPEEIEAANAEVSRRHAAIYTLSEPDCTLLIAREINGLGIDETLPLVEPWGLTREQIKDRTYKARRKLERLMENAAMN